MISAVYMWHKRKTFAGFTFFKWFEHELESNEAVNLS